MTVIQLLTTMIHTSETTKKLGNMTMSSVASVLPDELEMEPRLEYYGAGRAVIGPTALQDLDKVRGPHRAFHPHIL